MFGEPVPRIGCLILGGGSQPAFLIYILCPTPNCLCHVLAGGPEFLRTPLGGNFLVYESFLYRREKVAGEKVYWTCRDQARMGCRSRAITKGRQVTVMRNHCHPPDLLGLETLRQREKRPGPTQWDGPGTCRDPTVFFSTGYMCPALCPSVNILEVTVLSSVTPRFCPILSPSGICSPRFLFTYQLILLGPKPDKPNLSSVILEAAECVRPVPYCYSESRGQRVSLRVWELKEPNLPPALAVANLHARVLALPIWLQRSLVSAWGKGL